MNKSQKNILIIIAIVFCLGILCTTIFVIVKNIYEVRKEMTNDINENQNTTSEDSSNNSETTDYGLTIVGDKGTTDNNWYYVVGNLINNSQNNYEEIIIQYIALDEDGYNLTTCSDVVYNLNAGETYPFRATCPTNKDNVASYKIKNLMPVKSVK